MSWPPAMSSVVSGVVFRPTTWLSARRNPTPSAATGEWRPGSVSYPGGPTRSRVDGYSVRAIRKIGAEIECMEHQHRYVVANPKRVEVSIRSAQLKPRRIPSRHALERCAAVLAARALPTPRFRNSANRTEPQLQTASRSQTVALRRSHFSRSSKPRALATTRNSRSSPVNSEPLPQPSARCSHPASVASVPGLPL
jgi:hypothetical protein